MLTKSQQDRIARRCTTALVEAIDAFPDLLAHSSPEAGAAIVALLIRTQITSESPQEEKTLEDIIREIAASDTDD